MKSKLKILFLVPEDYDSLNTKGITHMILERDENGFFEKVITIHPLAFQNRILVLNEKHMLYEFNLRKLFYPYQLGMLLPLFPFKLLFIIKKLVSIIKKEKIDLIRATDPYLMGFIAWLLSRLTGIPFCISIHTDYELVFSLNPTTRFKEFLRLGSKWMPDFILPKAKLVMPISNYLINVISQKVKKEKIKVILHGIDFNFQPQENLREIFSIPSNKKIISFVGRLSKDNYIKDILQILEKISLLRDDFIFVLIGGGEEELEIKKWLSSRSELSSCIRLLGFQSNAIGRSFRYISHISLCLMGGLSLIEAAAASSPSIAYDIEWHNELIENHKTGFIVKENHVDKVIEAILYLLDHPNEAIQMGKEAKKRAFQAHDIIKTSASKKRYYLSLLEKESF